MSSDTDDITIALDTDTDINVEIEEGQPIEVTIASVGIKGDKGKKER